MPKRIALVLENTEPPHDIVDCVAEQAVCSGGKVFVVNVEPTPVAVSVSPTGGQMTVLPSAPAAALVSAQQSSMRASMERLVREFAVKGIEAEWTTLVGALAESLAVFASDKQIDLIAMTTRMHRGWKRFFLGSRVEDVLRECDVPVLVLKW